MSDRTDERIRQSYTPPQDPEGDSFASIGAEYLKEAREWVVDYVDGSNSEEVRGATLVEGLQNLVDLLKERRIMRLVVVFLLGWWLSAIHLHDTNEGRFTLILGLVGLITAFTVFYSLASTVFGGN